MAIEKIGIKNKFAQRARYLLIIVALLAAVVLAACGGTDYDEYPDAAYNDGYDPAEYANADNDTDPAVSNGLTLGGGQGRIPDYVRDQNLARLGKVWGFAKYHHDAFISGRLDWDAELMRLIPIVSQAAADEVNGILYEWFVGLGDDGFDLEFGHDFVLDEFIAELYANIAMLEAVENMVHEMGTWHLVVSMQEFHEYLVAARADGRNLDFSEILAAGQQWASASLIMSLPQADFAFGAYARPMVDLSWINADFLGITLATRLQSFDGIRTFDRSNAPVHFEPNNVPIFDNLANHAQADFSDPAYRLLGLFRLWNTMKYYFPHLDVLDVVWNDLLIEFIARMLEDTCRTSYERTLAAMAHHLHDGHIFFRGMTFFEYSFGRYIAQVNLRTAEGRLVVSHSSWPFARGDVIVSLNGRDIDEILAEMLQYISYPTADKALQHLLAHHPLRSHERDMDIVVLRDNEQINLAIRGSTALPPRVPFDSPSLYSVLLDGNIGYINPTFMTVDTMLHVMESFANTAGLIIDLRYYPQGPFFLAMTPFLLESPQHFASATAVSTAFPGARDTVLMYHTFADMEQIFIYSNPVMILACERTISHAEFVIMMLRMADNVTVIGADTLGANGNVTSLPLPGGITMWFTSIGIYTPEGGQTHRIGLAPDIRVTRTIQGIAEGRDEILEAAVRVILGNIY